MARVQQVVVVGAVASAVLVTLGVQSSLAGSPAPAYQACATNGGRLILRSSSGHCPSGSHGVLLGQRGATGATGRTGATGKTGPRGPGAIALYLDGVTKKAARLGSGDVAGLSCTHTDAFDSEVALTLTPPAKNLSMSITGSEIESAADVVDYTSSGGATYNTEPGATDTDIVDHTNTTSYELTVQPHNSGVNGGEGDAVLHLLVRRGSAVYSLDLSAQVDGASCAATVEIVPTS